MRLVSLDDEDVAVPIASDSRVDVEILPGKHAVAVKDGDARNPLLVPLVFRAEAGRVCGVMLAPSAGVFEVDRIAARTRLSAT